MNAGLYIRVSSDMQVRDGESLDEQESTARAYCKFRDISVVTVYREEGKSAKDTNRPQFQKMLRDCSTGKIDTVIVKKVDRLSRSLMDFEKTVTFFEEHNINLISIQENFDTSSAIGRAVIRIILTFAQLEREQTSERTSDVLQYRATQGQWNGGYPSLGYQSDDELGLLPIAGEAKLVKLLFDKYEELASYRKVSAYLNDAGYRTKTFTSRRGKIKGGARFIDTTVASILKNPIYIGMIRYKENLYQGKHQPLIDKEQFQRAQEIMKHNGERRTSICRENKHNFILDGLVRCGECGSVMSPRWSVSRSKKRYFYYGCGSVNHNGVRACGTRVVSAHLLEQVILARIRYVSKDDTLLDRIISRNEESLRKEIDGLEDKQIILKLRLKETEEKAATLVNNMATLPGMGAISFITEGLQRLDKEKQDIARQLAETAVAADRLKQRAINRDLVKESFQRFTTVYPQLAPPQKRGILRLLVREVTYGRDAISISFYESDEVLKAEGAAAKPASWFAATPYWLLGAGSKQNFTDHFKIVTYQGNKGKYFIRICDDEGAGAQENTLPGSEDGRWSEATGRPDRWEAGQSPCEELAV